MAHRLVGGPWHARILALIRLTTDNAQRETEEMRAARHLELLRSTGDDLCARCLQTVSDLPGISKCQHLYVELAGSPRVGANAAQILPRLHRGSGKDGA